jgi:LysM repeat protein
MWIVKTVKMMNKSRNSPNFGLMFVKVNVMKSLMLLILLSPLVLFASVKDSIGTKTVEGKVYIIHKIQSGETLFAIARKYNANPQEVIRANPGSEKTIRAGENLMIPTSRTSTAAESTSNKTTPTQSAKYHTVASGETLFKIATAYNISIDDIKSWNNLSNDNISVGQRLIVSKNGTQIVRENKAPVETAPPPPVEKPKREIPPPAERHVPREVVKEAQTEPARQGEITNRDVVKRNEEKVEGNPSNETPTASVPSRAVTRLGNEVIETGKVEIKAEGELGQERNFIIHPTAKIGTIVMITNPVTGSSAFARVVANKTLQAEYVAIINPTLAQKLGINENSPEIKVNYAL